MNMDVGCVGLASEIHLLANAFLIQCVQNFDKRLFFSLTMSCKMCRLTKRSKSPQQLSMRPVPLAESSRSYSTLEFGDRKAAESKDKC